MKYLLVLLALFSGSPDICNIEIVNTWPYAINYTVFWIDHPHEFNYPMQIMGGELLGKESKTSVYTYPPGDYYVCLSNSKTKDKIMYFRIKAGIEKIIITWDGINEARK